ncbi:3-ketoacyl-ACP reductase [Paraburkholderia sp. HD33-4]|uniref:3-ketoacyl-ACP reductase n=1 Tax=Paraburkholderia sp. HD33-4 TaxID=2883242 RepID=UPI001F3FF630|nr:3-ketoacyl-ACP reductase [Paraburkholderia sp. HD33-4]
MEPKKVALVTGARRGIGRATAYALAEAGFDVLINDVVGGPDADETLLGIAQRGARGVFFEADISDLGVHAPLIKQVYESFGRLDCLVNNAGVQIAVRGDILDVPPEEFDRLININLKGTFFLTQEAARCMLAESPSREGRSIVTITSANATMVSPEKSVYCVSKSGLSMAVQLFAVRLAKAGIALFEVRPGLIATDMTAQVRDYYSDRMDSGLVPIPRWGRPEDIAQAIKSLASGALPYATGHAIEIDGGLLLPRL